MQQKSDNEPKKRFKMELTVYEIDLILELRKYEFGTFEVYKTGGEPQRISKKEFKLLKYENVISKLDIVNGKVK